MNPHHLVMFAPLLCANVAILENTIIPYSGILEDKIFFSKPKFPAPAGLSSIIITVPHPAIRVCHKIKQ